MIAAATEKVFPAPTACAMSVLPALMIR